MIRVANVVPDERFAGPHSRIIQVGARLAPKGYETILVVPRGEVPYQAMLARSGVRLRQVSLSRIRATGRLGSVARWLRRVFGEARDLAHLVAQDEVALVHANGVTNLQAALAARRAGIALVWHLNDMLLPRWLARLAGPVVRRLADLIAVSSRAVATFHGLDGDRVQVLYPPVDCALHADRTARERLRQAWGVDAAPVVGMIGHLHPGKGHRFFLEAAAAIRKAGAGAKFVIVGAPLANHQRYAEELARLVERLGLGQEVRFLGLQMDVAPILSAMDVFVHPSLSESAGMVVLEAAAAGLPVVASGIGGVPELLADGRAGCLVRPGDSGAIAESVLRLLRDPRAREALAAAGRSHVAQVFDIERCAERHVAAYQAALAHRGRRG